MSERYYVALVPGRDIFGVYAQCTGTAPIYCYTLGNAEVACELLNKQDAEITKLRALLGPMKGYGNSRTTLAVVLNNVTNGTGYTRDAALLKRIRDIREALNQGGDE